MLLSLLAQATDTIPDFPTTADTAATAAASTAAVGLGIGMLVFWIIFGGVGFVIWLWALIDVIRRKFTNDNDKILWLVLVIVLGSIGALVYLIVGRKKGTIPGGTSTPTTPAAQ